MDSISIAQITLWPASFSRKQFDFGLRLQPVVNQLYHKIANNHHFLNESMRKTIESDQFIAKLFQIYNTVMREGLTQKTSLGLFRSDYMMNECFDGKYDLKQIEVNTMA